MSRHTTVEELSRYLDEELETGERRSVESHLGDCGSCRERLGGLRRVVDELERLQEAAPPKALGARVRRRLKHSSRRGLMARLEERARRTPATAPLLPLFGVLLALVVIVYLLSLAVARWERFGPGNLVAPPAATAPAEAGEAGWRRLAGRDFRRVDGIWIERGIDPASAATPIENLEPAAVAHLSELAALDRPVRLRWNGRVIELDPAELAPPAGAPD